MVKNVTISTEGAHSLPPAIPSETIREGPQGVYKGWDSTIPDLLGSPNKKMSVSSLIFSKATTLSTFEVKFVYLSNLERGMSIGMAFSQDSDDG
ncbi:hypothetical protein Tco_1261308 [Tanacetum coccineum]